ncbi:MAG: uroporphyrinogen-III synthase [Bacteroidota bacterium]
MNTSVFISRDLPPDSPFRGMLASRGCTVSGNSLITINPEPFELVPTANWIFFYSKNGVEHFYSQLDEDQKRKLPVRVATLGSATAKALDKWAIPPTFIGNGDPLETAEMFVEIAIGQHVLFPQARQSRQSVQSILEEHILPISLVVYSNKKKAEVPKQNETCLVFTSPLNAQSYFDKHNIDSHQKVIAIGKTTGSALADLGLSDYVVSKSPKEDILAETVAQLLL